MTKVYFDMSAAQKELFDFDSESALAENVNTLCAVGWLNSDYPHGLIENAWNIVFEKEQGLRLRLCPQNGTAKLYEEPYSRVCLPVLDLTQKTKAELGLYFQSVAGVSLPLWDSPLCSLTFFNSDFGAGILLKSHHIIMDGYNVGLLFSKISQTCFELSENLPVSEQGHSFTDFLNKEAKALQSPRHQSDILFWKSRFENWNGLCRLNPDRTVYGAKGKRLQKHLSADLSKRLSEFSTARRLSLSVLFETAFAIYLHLKNPDKNIVSIGLNLLNRATDAEKNTLGLFSAERVLFVQFSQTDTCADALRKVAQNNALAYYHSTCLHDAVLELAHDCDPNTNAVRDVEFSFQPYCPDLRRDFKAEWIANFSPEVAMEFTVSNAAAADDFQIVCDYQEGVFTDDKALTFYADYVRIVEKIIQSDDALITGSEQ